MSAPTDNTFGGRQAPCNLEAEQAALGAMLVDPDAALRAVGQLDDWMFFKESHRRLFRAMIAVARRQEPVDPILLKAELEAKGELEDVGGVDYLSYLLDVVPSVANFDYHAHLVRDKALLRRLIEVGTQIVQDAFQARTPAIDICEAAEQRIFGVAEHRRTASSFERLGPLLFPAMEQIEATADGGRRVTGVPSGFTDLDERTCGFHPANLVIVAARPSMGKTALALNIAQHAAIEHKIGVAIFSLEMAKAELVQRLITAEARVDAHRVRSGTLSRGDYALMASAAGVMSAAPIWIDDSSSLTPLELRAKARRQAADMKNLGLVIVDYIQLMREPEAKSREQEISAISRSLKALAKELRVPVLALSQLSRAPEQRTGKQGKRPQLSDLRDSGGIEQDADVVLFIYRPEMYAKDEMQRDELRGEAEIIIGKQRNGPTGTVKLAFQSSYTRFDNRLARDNERGEQQDFTPALQRPRRTRADIDA